MTSNEYTLTFLGDIMLGRLIDHLLPTNVNEPEDAQHVANFRHSYAHLQNYDFASPWGNTLPLLQRSSLVLGNLETAVTIHDVKWPDKVFNYRMHPANVECLKVAKIAYVSLANNHTLDFGKKGLLDTVRVVDEAGIVHAGAGRNMAEAERPAVLKLPQSQREIHLYSFSDHPRDWSQVPEFNLLQYDSEFRLKLKALMTKHHPGLASKPDLKICSIHWGPNYSWRPNEDIVSLAHFLIDECGVDIIHGHSSHHIQGVEIHNSRLIIYGCGDFVDDYAVVPEYRNDLSAVWNVQISSDPDEPLKLHQLEVFPNRIRKFQAELLDARDADHKWVCQTFHRLCNDFDTIVDQELGEHGQVVVRLDTQQSNE